MKEPKYSLQLKYFSSNISVLQKKTPTPNQHIFQVHFKQSFPLVLLSSFGFVSELKDQFLLLSLGKQRLSVILQLQPSATNISA